MKAANVADLAAFRRRFVRGKDDPSSPEYDPASDDTFFMGIACAEMAAHHDELDCAACGSPDIVRTPMKAPDRFGTVTTKTGHLYASALCEPCNELPTRNVGTLTKRVDEAFDRARGAVRA